MIGNGHRTAYIQILDEVACILYCTNILKKGENATMGK